jgi:hypothetical protein
VVKVGGISIGPGSAGGLLLVGILVGFLGSLNPTLGLMPAPARSFLMDFGLVLFMAEVGLKAGAGAVEALTSVGPELIAAGALVTLAPVGVGYAVAPSGLNPAPLGSITAPRPSTIARLFDRARGEPFLVGYAGPTPSRMSSPCGHRADDAVTRNDSISAPAPPALAVSISQACCVTSTPVLLPLVSPTLPSPERAGL